jgi:hypothetical protein
MALTRQQLGEMYYTKGRLLERRFLGTVLHMTRQILDGGYPTPNAEQTAWATAMVGVTLDQHSAQARSAMEWGLVHNSTLQAGGNEVDDSALDYIVAEYAKTYT